jgi:hypothetical protein
VSKPIGTGKAKVSKYVESIAGLFELARMGRPDLYILPTDAEVRGIFTPILDICNRHGWLPEGEISLDGQDIVTCIVVCYMYSMRVRVTAQASYNTSSGYTGNNPDSAMTSDAASPEQQAAQKMSALLQMDALGRMNA